jgi:hypothetical protein
MKHIGPHSALILARRCEEYEEEIAHLMAQIDIMQEVLVAAQESWMRNMDDATMITYMARDALDKCSDMDTKFTQERARKWAKRDAQIDTSWG